MQYSAQRPQTDLLTSHKCSIFRHGSHLRCSISQTSLTNSLTNSTSYHIRSQISHLTVLKFAHQFAPSSVRLDWTVSPMQYSLIQELRQFASKPRSKAAQLAQPCDLIVGWVASKMLSTFNLVQICPFLIEMCHLDAHKSWCTPGTKLIEICSFHQKFA